jgi:hypothetical protein
MSRLHLLPAKPNLKQPSRLVRKAESHRNKITISSRSYTLQRMIFAKNERIGHRWRLSVADAKFLSEFFCSGASRYPTIKHQQVPISFASCGFLIFIKHVGNLLRISSSVASIYSDVSSEARTRYPAGNPRSNPARLHRGSQAPDRASSGGITSSLHGW